MANGGQGSDIVWKCPLCAKKGHSKNVTLRQVNDYNAIYCCDGNKCTYPLHVLKVFPLKNRHYKDIEISQRQLSDLGLGYSRRIPTGQTVKLGDLDSILEKKLVSGSSEMILTVDKEWKEFLQRMSRTGITLPSEASQLQDPDLGKLS